MFESRFKIVLSNITGDVSLAHDLWAEIKSNYNSPGRHYHNLTHLDNLTIELSALGEAIADWQTMMFSIAYHDIIYDPLQQDNEEKSAAFAFARLTLLDLPDSQKQKCSSQILATKAHNLADDSDSNYFTDADLAILGSDAQTYNAYAKAIRKEYAVYPDSIYKPGRKKVLTHFLQMPEIYKTKYFRDKYETEARNNLSNELGELL